MKIEGLEEALKRIEKLGDTQHLEQSMGRACALVERAAKQKAPKGAGELRRSIASRIEKSAEEINGIVFTPLEYAPYVEFGTGLFAEVSGRKDVPWHYQDDEGEWHTTSGQPPHPYLRPALEENRERIKQIISEGLNND